MPTIWPNFLKQSTTLTPPLSYVSFIFSTFVLSLTSFVPQVLLVGRLILITLADRPRNPGQTMPKTLRPSTQQGRYRANPISIEGNILQQQRFYPDIATTMQSSMASQNMGSSPYSTGGPVQLPNQHQYMSHSQPVQPQAQISLRASSGAWSPTDDSTLMNARAQGLNWAPIQATYFPSKTPNACRKRHERLMDRRNTDDWDTIKLETLAKEYMGMRREIWAPLAARTGEKWSIVEAKCMSSGLKNLQSASRACARRERLENGLEDHLSHGAYGDPHADDSGIGIEDLEAEYSVDGGSYGSSPERSYGGGGVDPHHHQHQRHMSDGRSSTYGGDRMASDGRAYMQGMQQAGMAGAVMGRPQYGMQQRLPSIDMGIGAIINRNPQM